MAEDENRFGVFTGLGNDGQSYSGGFGVPPPEYYEEPWMDEDGFDEAGNYVGRGFFSSIWS